MLAAHSLGMTNGQWVFIDVELFRSYMFGNKHWRRNDTYDEMAREAYRSLIRIAIRENKTTTEYMTFAEEVVKRVEKQFGPRIFQPGEEVGYERTLQGPSHVCHYRSTSSWGLSMMRSSCWPRC